MTESTEDWSKKEFKQPRPVLPELTRLIQGTETELPDPRAIRNAVILQLGRGNAFECPNHACRRTRICQRPAYKCHLAHYADIYDWDDGLPNCPRAPMYEEIYRRIRERKFTDDLATELSEVVLSFQPELDKKRRYWPGMEPGTKREG